METVPEMGMMCRALPLKSCTVVVPPGERNVPGIPHPKAIYCTAGCDRQPGGGVKRVCNVLLMKKMGKEEDGQRER